MGSGVPICSRPEVRSSREDNQAAPDTGPSRRTQRLGTGTASSSLGLRLPERPALPARTKLALDNFPASRARPGGSGLPGRTLPRLQHFRRSGVCFLRNPQFSVERRSRDDPGDVPVSHFADDARVRQHVLHKFDLGAVWRGKEFLHNRLTLELRRQPSATCCSLTRSNASAPWIWASGQAGIFSIPWATKAPISIAIAIALTRGSSGAGPDLDWRKRANPSELPL